jgi:hypothetical protein
MRTRQHLIIIKGALLTVLTSGAQEKQQVDEAAAMSTTRQIYNQAESDYNIGRIDQAISLLHLQFSLDCENIFNTDHYICGPNSQHVPHFQRGRSLMASLSYNF